VENRGQPLCMTVCVLRSIFYFVIKFATEQVPDLYPSSERESTLRGAAKVLHLVTCRITYIPNVLDPMYTFILHCMGNERAACIVIM
jgi:hypothetical protein